jgi:hypothetical protein
MIQEGGSLLNLINYNPGPSGERIYLRPKLSLISEDRDEFVIEKQINP